MILDQIVEDKRRRLPQHKARVSEREMRGLAEEALREQRRWELQRSAGPGTAARPGSDTGAGTAAGLGTAVGEGTAAGLGTDTGAGTAAGLGTAVGLGTDTGAGTAVGLGTAVGPGIAAGPGTDTGAGRGKDGILSSLRGAVSFYDSLRKPGISIIGEFKQASPSLGSIASRIGLLDRIGEYNESVDAISCLTEEDHFLGNIDYLREIRGRSPLPILRKDFMIEEYQFYEARVIGADAVLLITAILDDVQMKDFYQLARELELDVLVETHDEAEVERALRIDPRIIGVNNRNLKDFSISLENTRRLRPLVPADKVFVAESGIMGDGDVAFLRETGVDAFLIGRAFMEAENPRELARSWKR